MNQISCIKTLALVAALALSAAGQAQDRYPTRPVTIILPLAAGSASDIAVRVIGEKLAESLQQSFPVENVPGAAGLIGTERLLKARPDGYTLAALNNSITTILPNINPDKTRFDALRDFVPISGLANIPTLLSVNKDVPIASVRELIAYAKANPGKLNYSSGGSGSPQHLATEMFQAMSGTQLTHVPYKGATQAAADLASGQVQVMFIAHSLALPFLSSGRVKPIAFAGPARSGAFPDLPTVAESGVPNFDYSSWIALFAPRGTPNDVVQRLRVEIDRILARPDIKERFAKSGLELWNRSPEALTATIRDDFVRGREVVKVAKITAD